MRTTMVMTALVAANLAGPALAHELTTDECREAGEFIMHAAMSRDAGLSRDAFVSRMQADLLVIQAYPPQMRWFVQDESDEALLVSHAEQVFDEPRAPDAHQQHFLQACLERIAEQDASKGDMSAEAPGDPERSR